MAKKKKAPEPAPRREGDFSVQGCDLSMYGPGFAQVRYHADTRTAELVKTDCLNYKSAYHRKKPHGQVLVDIAHKLGELMLLAPDATVVREKAFSKFHRETQTLHKVVGVTDMILWQSQSVTFLELTPTQIKKAIADHIRAEKEKVAAGLIPYLGEHEYATDDESDAAAVAVAFLLIEGYLDPIPLDKPTDSQEEAE